MPTDCRVLVNLREFWDRLPGTAAMSGRDLEATVGAWLEDRNAPGVSTELLAAHIARGSALLVFDGIDEVPPSRRVALLHGLAESREAWTAHGNRIVVTSRPYGLTDVEIRRLGLSHVPIRPMPDTLQRLLVRRWFRILRDEAEQADASAGEMLRQVREQAWLGPLIENPLLLTGMCIVFGDGKGLPEDKYQLYDRVATPYCTTGFPIVSACSACERGWPLWPTACTLGMGWTKSARHRRPR